MRRAVLTASIFILSVGSLMAQTPAGPDLERFRPTEEEAWKIAEYSREMGRIEKNLARLYGDLKLLGYISDNDESLIQVRTSHLNQFERRDSTLSEETVRIVWKNGAPAQFTMRVRTATVRGLRTIITFFKIDSVLQGEQIREPDIDFISIESLPTGRGNLVYYTLTAWDGPVLTEKTRTFQDGGVTLTFPFSQVRTPSQKIEIMYRMLDSYRYLERHLDYLISRSIKKEMNDMNRYMPKS